MTTKLRLAFFIVALMAADVAFAIVTEDDVNRAYHASDVAVLERIRTELD